MNAQRLTVASQASAQTCNIAVTSCNVATTVSATVPTIAQLTLSTVSTTLNGPVDNLLDSVAINTVGPSATVKANVGWHLQISSAANWTGTGSAGTKLIGDFSWATTALGSYTAVTTTAANIVNSATGSKTTQPMFYAAGALLRPRRVCTLGRRGAARRGAALRRQARAVDRATDRLAGRGRLHGDQRDRQRRPGV